MTQNKKVRTFNCNWERDKGSGEGEEYLLFYVFLILYILSEHNIQKLILVDPREDHSSLIARNSVKYFPMKTDYPCKRFISI